MVFCWDSLSYVLKLLPFPVELPPTPLLVPLLPALWVFPDAAVSFPDGAVVVVVSVVLVVLVAPSGSGEGVCIAAIPAGMHSGQGRSPRPTASARVAWR